MSPSDPDPREPDDADGPEDDTEVPIDVETPEERSKRQRLGVETDRAVEQFDEGVIDLLAWILDTETRSRIYVYLRKYPGSTSEEIAEGTGLYPSTVREALAELHAEETVTRSKRESEGAGNNPYEYRAIPPSKLVGGMVQQVQDELNTLFNLDRYLGDDDLEAETEPITITVEKDAEEAEGDEWGGVDLDGGDTAGGVRGDVDDVDDVDDADEVDDDEADDGDEN